jgi:hypothetical protein
MSIIVMSIIVMVVRGITVKHAGIFRMIVESIRRSIFEAAFQQDIKWVTVSVIVFG